MDELRVLIADQAEQHIFLLKSVLEHNHYQVTVCKNSKEVLSKIQERAFDLVITDDSFGGASSLEMIQDIRREAGAKQPKIMMLSFKDLSEMEVRKLSVLEVMYLKKPFLPNDLVYRIENLFI